MHGYPRRCCCEYSALVEDTTVLVAVPQPARIRKAEHTKVVINRDDDMRLRPLNPRHWQLPWDIDAADHEATPRYKEEDREAAI